MGTPLPPLPQLPPSLPSFLPCFLPLSSLQFALRSIRAIRCWLSQLFGLGMEEEKGKQEREREREREIERKGEKGFRRRCRPPHCRQCTRQSFRSAAQFSSGFWFSLSLSLSISLEWIVSLAGVKSEGASSGDSGQVVLLLEWRSFPEVCILSAAHALPSLERSALAVVVVRVHVHGWGFVTL